jgi:hypothetical protein
LVRSTATLIFFYAVADATAMMDQYGQKDLLCQGLSELPPHATDEQRIANLGSIITTHYGPSFVGGCFYDTECFKKVPPPGEASHGVGNRQWRWQKCNEVGYLQSAPADDSVRIRSKTLTHAELIAQCTTAFTKSAVVTSAKSAKFASKFGGARPDELKPPASNIVFLDYSDDPWSEVSVRKTLDSSLPFCLTTCDGCGHCGAGVPRDDDHCDKVATSNVEKWLR